METITDISQLDPNKQYTYADYLTWRFEERVELIKGWLYKMSPAPKRRHQRVSVNLLVGFATFLQDKTCQVYDAPFDVRLKRSTANGQVIDTVVQPDICIFCDLNKLDEMGAVGAPELVVEITSPASLKIDYNDKFRLYEENGVLEYWVVQPEANVLEVFVLADNKFVSAGVYEPAGNHEYVSSKLFPELNVSLKSIFKE